MAWKKLKPRRRSKRRIVPTHRNPPLDSRIVGEVTFPPMEPNGFEPLAHQVEDYSESLRRKWGIGGMNRQRLQRYLKKVLPTVDAEFSGLLLGTGARGAVYEVEYEVYGEPTIRALKVSIDPDEAAACVIAMKHGHWASCLPDIDGVYQTPTGEFLIFREDVPYALDKRNTPGRVLKEVVLDYFLDEFNGNKHLVTQAFLAWFLWAGGHGQQAIIQEWELMPQYDEDIFIELGAADVQAAQMWRDYIRCLGQVVETMGVRFLDLHDENLRLRKLPGGDYEIVVSDLGIAAVTQNVKIPVVNPRRR